SYTKMDNFDSYFNWIWKQKEKPDVVLIDGRFRVACFLTSVLYANPNTKIIFDDYTDRTYYHIVETVLPKKDLNFNTRQALFIVPHLTNEQRATALSLLDNFKFVMD